MNRETKFRVEVTEEPYKTKHYSINVKYNERFDVFVLTVKLGKDIEYDDIKDKIEDIKSDVTKDIEDGYLRRNINYTYKS